MDERNKQGTFEQIAAGYWDKIDKRLPSHLTNKQRTWIKNYLQAQVAIKEKDPLEATKIFTRLDREEGFEVFEEKHPEYFATMEIVVRGKTNREFVKILFGKEDL